MVTVPTGVPIPGARLRASAAACRAFVEALYAPVGGAGIADAFVELRPIPTLGQSVGRGGRDPLRRWLSIGEAGWADALVTAAHWGDEQVGGRQHRYTWDADARRYVETASGGIPGQLYYAVQPRTDGGGKIEDVQGFVTVYADLELAKPCPTCPGIPLSVAGPALLSLPCPPSALVWSGWGVHAYWFFQAWVGLLDTERVRRLVGGIAARCEELHLHPDPKVKDASRVLRLPGTHNRKRGECRSVELLYLAPDARYTLVDLEDAFPSPAPAQTRWAPPGVAPSEWPPFEMGPSWHDSARAYLARCRALGADDAALDELARVCAEHCPPSKRSFALALIEARKMAAWTRTKPPGSPRRQRAA